MFSKVIEIELEEVPSSPTGPYVQKQQYEHSKDHLFGSEPAVPQISLVSRALGLDIQH